MSVNHVLRRALIERLKSIGLSPDLVNDEAAVAAVCQETGCSRDQVALELVNVRVERGAELLKSMGLPVVPPAFLASAATSRHILAEGAASPRRFAEQFAEKLKLRAFELREELGLAESASPDPKYRPAIDR
jgi:hypothetical protein